MSEAGAEKSLSREHLDTIVGRPTGSGSAPAPDPVNTAMIRHWVDAMDDRNPVYLDAEVAAGTRHGGIIAPPAMLQTWTMSRPTLEGIAERGGAPTEITSSPLAILDDAGFRGTVATNSELEFERPLRVGDHLTSSTVIETVSDEKRTALGVGHFVTWLTTYTDQSGAVVGRQRFRILKFRVNR